MVARQYDNDTVLHYVSTLLGMLWEHSVRLFPDEEPHFNSKKCQHTRLRTPRAGWRDDACMCVYMYVCEWVDSSVMDRAKEGRWSLYKSWLKWNVFKCIGLTLSDCVQCSWQQREIYIAHFSKMGLSTYSTTVMTPNLYWWYLCLPVLFNYYTVCINGHIF